MRFFIFNFMGGGFNSVWAESREAVVPTYQIMNGYVFTIDEKSIRELSEEQIEEYWNTFKQLDRSKWGKIS